MPRKKLIAANWKMYKTPEQAQAFFRDFLPLVAGHTRDEIAVCLPFVDISGDAARQFVVDREAGQYLGHPTTVLLEDGRTLLCVYPKGHGKGAIQLKRSTDGGRTWSPRLPVPENWATSLETPTIHRVVTSRLIRRRLLPPAGQSR